MQEAKNEYSKLDPKKFPEEEEEEDAYPDLGDLEANDLIQFAYHISPGTIGFSGGCGQTSRYCQTT